MIFVDTSVLVDYLRGKSTAAVEMLASLEANYQLASGYLQALLAKNLGQREATAGPVYTHDFLRNRLIRCGCFAVPG
jgi:predicted nucleic acid-binding protein